MSEPSILYLHGFTSGPQSAKAVALRARLRARGLDGGFACPQLPASPREAIALAEGILVSKLSHGNTPAVIGSSLGGWYAAHLAEKHGLRAVLVNPAVVPALSPELFIGRHRFIHTGEEFDFTREHVEELHALAVARFSHPERLWLLVEKGDEVLDWRDAAAWCAGARQTVLEGGDHGFTRWADYLDEIIRFCS